MESKPLVFETPDPPQTIEELNSSLLSRAPMKGLVGIESGNTDLNIKEIFQFFEELTSVPPKVSYKKDSPAPLPTSEKLIRLQAEVRELQALDDPDSREALEALNSQLMHLHELNSAASVQALPTDAAEYSAIDFTGGISFTLRADPDQVSKTEALKLAELDVEVRRLDKLIGVLQSGGPVSSEILRMNLKLDLLDPLKLERIDTQAKSLGNELDLLSSSKMEFALEDYALEGLKELGALDFPDLLEVVESLAVSGPMHNQNLALAESLARLEHLADSLLEEVGEDTEVVQELLQGIAANRQVLGSLK
jgi:hypothetical protein